MGAFGFLSSDEIYRYGTVNAGLLDQTFALQWVQSYIDLFGGNASQVTIAGLSAGAGAVMLQTMAFGGTLGESLFSNVSAKMLPPPGAELEAPSHVSVGYHSFTVFASTIWLCRLCAHTVLLCFRRSCWVFWRIPSGESQRLHLSVFGWQRHGNASERQRLRIWKQ